MSVLLETQTSVFRIKIHLFCRVHQYINILNNAKYNVENTYELRYVNKQLKGHHFMPKRKKRLRIN